MKNLSMFLAGNVNRVGTTLYAASDRMIDPETGKPIEWEIKCITAEENTQLRKTCIKSVPVPGGRGGRQFTQEIDAAMYQQKIAAACTVFPDLQNDELLSSYGAATPERLLGVMLTPGEYEDYTAKVFEVNGFLNDKSELVEEAKN